jgi:dTMP kinase
MTKASGVIKQTPARYIVLEGVQGTGKSTQIDKLQKWLEDEGVVVHRTREPGGADLVARSVRTITQDPTYPLNTKAEVLLYNAARAQSLENVRKMLERGVWVISDRNYLTTLAIQYYARDSGLDYKDIDTICRFAVGDMEPDLTVVLDLDPKIAHERTRNRYQAERFDNLRLDFLKRMRDGYFKEAKKHKLPLVDASGTEDAVFKKIKKLIGDL